MDRTVATQLIALVIVLAALLRWVPDDDPRDLLGLGDPGTALRIDNDLSTWDEDDMRRAYLRAVRYPDPEYFNFWKNKLRRARYIYETRDADTFVQLKGFGRNNLWPVIYDLYPVRVVARTYEEGSRSDDEDLPGAEIMKSGIVPYQEMSEDQVRAVKQRRRKDDVRGRPKLPEPPAAPEDGK